MSDLPTPPVTEDPRDTLSPGQLAVFNQVTSDLYKYLASASYQSITKEERELITPKTWEQAGKYTEAKSLIAGMLGLTESDFTALLVEVLNPPPPLKTIQVTLQLTLEDAGQAKLNFLRDELRELLEKTSGDWQIMEVTIKESSE